MNYISFSLYPLVLTLAYKWIIKDSHPLNIFWNASYRPGPVLYMERELDPKAQPVITQGSRASPLPNIVCYYFPSQGLWVALAQGWPMWVNWLLWTDELEFLSLFRGLGDHNI
jgi:hypothetical protein